jgi:anti-sigma B factor antagonist
MTRSELESQPDPRPAASSADAAPATFELDIEVEGVAAVVNLKGELDIAAAPALTKALDELATRDIRSVVLDLRGLDFIDSSGLRAILRADALARDNGHELLLVRGTEAVQRVFELTRMDGRLNMLSAPGERPAT